MNLLLLDPQELQENPAAAAGSNLQQPSHRVTLQDHRAAHIIKVLGAKPGDSLKTGLLNGRIGRATVQSIHPQTGALQLDLSPAQFADESPPALACRVFVALPRPKAARRMLRMLAECGVKEIHFFHCYKVEKSYWSSPVLQAGRVREQFELGLSQAVDTVVPALSLHRLFKPFVEDALPGLAGGDTLLLADAAGGMNLRDALRCDKQGTLNLVIGPEGGLTGYEHDKLVAAGAQCVSLGPRTFSSAHALALLLGQLMQCRLQAATR